MWTATRARLAAVLLACASVAGCGNGAGRDVPAPDAESGGDADEGNPEEDGVADDAEAGGEADEGGVEGEVAGEGADGPGDAEPPELTAAIELAPTEGLAALTVSAVGIVTGGSGRYWAVWDFDADDGVTPDGIGLHATYTYGRAGTYDVTLALTDDAGSSVSAEASVVVAEPPYVPCDPVAIVDEGYDADHPRVVENCDFSGAAEYHVLVENSSNVVVRHCRFRDDPGLYFTPDPDEPSARVTSDAAVTLRGASGVRVENCVFERVEAGILASAWSWNLRFEGNFLRDVNNTPDVRSPGAIHLVEVNNVVVAANHIRHVGHVDAAADICSGSGPPSANHLGQGIGCNAPCGTHDIVIERNRVGDGLGGPIGIASGSPAGCEDLPGRIRIADNVVDQFGYFEPLITVSQVVDAEVTGNVGHFRAAPTAWCPGMGMALLGVRGLVVDNNLIVGAPQGIIAGNLPDLVMAHNTFVGDPDRPEDCPLPVCHPVGVQWLDGGAEANPDIIGVGPSDNAAVVGNLFYDFDRTWTSRDEGPDFFGSNALFLPDDRAARLGSASYQYLAAGAMAEGAVRRFLVLTNAVRDPGFVDPGGGVYLLRADSPVAGLVDGLHVPGIQEERDVGYLSALPRVVATDGENLLLNPGAETATTDGWELLAGGPAARFDAAANAEVAGTTVEPRSGAHLFRVGGTAAGEPARVSQGGIALSPAAAERIDAGSAVFELLVPFATGERGTGTGLTIQVSFESGDTPGVPLPGIRVGGGYGNAWFSPGRFRTAAFHGLVPPGARRAGVDLFLHAGPGGSFEAALDDVSFSLLGE